MPRRPKQPPVPEMRIEGLSTGKAVLTEPLMYDDFEPDVVIPKPVDQRPDRVLPGAEAIMAQRQRRVLAEKQKLWVMLKPDRVPQLGRTVELIPNGKMKIAEIAGKAVLIDKPKWRRF